MFTFLLYFDTEYVLIYRANYHSTLWEKLKVLVLSNFWGLLVTKYAVCFPKVANNHYQIIWSVLPCLSWSLIWIIAVFCNLRSHRKGLTMRWLVFEWFFLSFTHHRAFLLEKVPCSLTCFLCTFFRKVLSPEIFPLQL